MRYLFLVLLYCIQTTLGFAATDTWNNFVPNRQYLFAVNTFRGDKLGEFKGDPVAVLGDGSAWKVHPTEKEKFSKWSIRDTVHIGVRTTFYFFKREHKFEMFNHTRNESVKVMLVQNPQYPLKIVMAETFAKNTYQAVTTKDINGEPVQTYKPVTMYEKKLVMQDGSLWLIKSNEKNNGEAFGMGCTVYLGINRENDSYKTLLITGLEREAIWTWAKKLN